MPLKLRTLATSLSPQPDTAHVLHGLLNWIARADLASRHGLPRPALCRADAEPLFPVDEAWWLTDLERRMPRQSDAPDDLTEAQLDEEDLTMRPDEAGIEPSETESSDSAGSQCSLPAGPRPAKRGQSTTVPTVPRRVQTPARPLAPCEAPTPLVHRRLRGKRPAAELHMPRAPSLHARP